MHCSAVHCYARLGYAGLQVLTSICAVHAEACGHGITYRFVEGGLASKALRSPSWVGKHLCPVPPISGLQPDQSLHSRLWPSKSIRHMPDSLQKAKKTCLQPQPPSAKLRLVAVGEATICSNADRHMDLPTVQASGVGGLWLPCHAQVLRLLCLCPDLHILAPLAS